MEEVREGKWKKRRAEGMKQLNAGEEKNGGIAEKKGDGDAEITTTTTSKEGEWRGEDKTDERVVKDEHDKRRCQTKLLLLFVTHTTILPPQPSLSHHVFFRSLLH